MDTSYVQPNSHKHTPFVCLYHHSHNNLPQFSFLHFSSENGISSNSSFHLSRVNYNINSGVDFFDLMDLNEQNWFSKNSDCHRIVIFLRAFRHFKRKTNYFLCGHMQCSSVTYLVIQCKLVINNNFDMQQIYCTILFIHSSFIHSSSLPSIFSFSYKWLFRHVLHISEQNKDAGAPWRHVKCHQNSVLRIKPVWQFWHSYLCRSHCAFY